MSEDNRLERIELKIDDISEHIASVDTTLALQHQSLEEHMRRSDLLERKIEPLENHVALIHGLFKLLGVLGTIAAIISTALKLFKVI